MQAYPRTSDNRWTDIMTTVLKSHYYAPLLCCICSMFIYSVQMFLCGVCRIEERQCGSWLVFDVIYYLSTATSLFMEWCIDIVHWLAIHCLSFPTTKHCTPSRDIFIKYIRLLHALEIHVPYIVFIGGTRNMKYSRFIFFILSPFHSHSHPHRILTRRKKSVSDFCYWTLQWSKIFQSSNFVCDRIVQQTHQRAASCRKTKKPCQSIYIYANWRANPHLIIRWMSIFTSGYKWHAYPSPRG